MLLIVFCKKADYEGLKICLISEQKLQIKTLYYILKIHIQYVENISDLTIN